MKTLSLETLIALLEIPGMGRKKTRNLINHFPEACEMRLNEFIERGIKEKLVSQSVLKTDVQFSQDRAKEIIEKNDRYGIKVMSFWDKGFPKTFDFIDAPILFYYLGHQECLDQGRRVAIIGSRTPKKNGKEFAFSMGKRLSEKDAIIVSGLAIGCDTAAHRGCLSNNGQSIAFLPSGLLNIYPFENRILAEEILEKKGCLLSEYPLDEQAKPFHFIERDRLQAGASDFLVVSTFSETGGTLHTLKYAKRYLKKIVTSKEIVDETPKSFSKLSALGIPYEILSHDGILKKLDRNRRN